MENNELFICVIVFVHEPETFFIFYQGESDNVVQIL